VLPQADVVRSGDDPAVNLTGQATLPLGRIEIDQSVGSIEADGRPMPAVIVARSRFPGLVLHQVYALGTDRFYLLWFYCSLGVLQNLYVEDSKNELGGFLPVSGTCDDQPRSSPSSVIFPRTELQWPRVPGGFSVSGDSLQLDPGIPGAVLFGGNVEAALTFATVDCSDCGQPGWYELHALLWNPNGPPIIGIFYLEYQDTRHVVFDYGFDLASMTAEPLLSWPAIWRVDVPQ